MSKRKKGVSSKQKMHRGGSKPEQQDSDQDKQFDKAILQKFSQFKKRSRWEKLKERIHYFYGRNFPINYKDNYNFKERWQENASKIDEVSFFDVVQEQNFIFQILFAAIMVINVFVIWALTIKTFYCPEGFRDDLIESSLILGINSRIISAFLHLYIKEKQVETIWKFKIIMKVIGWDLAAALYFIISLIWQNQSLISIFFEAIIIVYLYLEAKKIYKLLGFITLSTFFEYKYKILDLVINLIITAHLFSLVLIATTWGNNKESWIKSIGVQNSDYMTKYIYAFYFCSTTILTVGYGDISPKNIKEICVVTIIQFLGVVFFGYLINQIGFNLSVMRKNEENLEKDLRTLNRIDKTYTVDKSLISKTKGYLLNHENYIDQLSPEQENKVLGKLNEELRDKVTFATSLSVIKSSIFFICRWSKDIQGDLAMKMQKMLLTPNERLLQPVGNQRIYLINKGKIDICLDRFGGNRTLDRRLLKTINVIDKDKVCQNIYGYTAVLSNRPCALDATASQFTSALFINKKDFQKCAFNDKLDRQYYHEVKANIDSAECCEVFQAPSIFNIREHYHPSRFILIRKQKKKLKNRSNPRSFNQRKQLKLKKHCFKNLNRIREQLSDKVLSRTFTLIDDDLYFPAQQLTEDVRKTLRMTLQNNEIKKRNQTRTRQGSIFRGATEILQIVNEDLQSNASLVSKFEKFLEYQNYFPNSNMENIIQKLNRENYMLKKKQEVLIFSSDSNHIRKKTFFF